MTSIPNNHERQYLANSYQEKTSLFDDYLTYNNILASLSLTGLNHLQPYIARLHLSAPHKAFTPTK